MCDLHDRLIEHARALGAQHVRIEHGGGRGSARRFRRHPHLTGEINGKPFEFPIKSRPRDASRGLFHGEGDHHAQVEWPVPGHRPDRPTHPRDEKWVEMNTIVMAERATEKEAERERDRRNGLKDGCSYFVMRADEYEQAA